MSGEPEKVEFKQNFGPWRRYGHLSCVPRRDRFTARPKESRRPRC